MDITYKEVPNTFYSIEQAQEKTLGALAERVARLRQQGPLSGEGLAELRELFRVKNIYHSNAIEGNSLDMGETKLVVQQGLTITGKPLKDQAEAKNLAQATEFLEELAADADRPIREKDIRELHYLVLKDIDDDNAGRYRTLPVEISGSEHTPAGPESVPSEMQEFGAWMERESCCPEGERASVRGLVNAAVAHTWFVYVHPFADGNGRVARLLMNLMLIRYGYPIAIVTREDRRRYYEALEESQSSNLSPFLSLLSECVYDSLEAYQRAADQRRVQDERLRSLAERFNAPEKKRAENEYQVWHRAVDLIRAYMRQTADDLDQASIGRNRVFFRDYEPLEFDQYMSLRERESTKHTWFFRVDFRRGDRSARYLFFFGYPSRTLRDTCEVTLHVSREDPAGSYNYERLEHLSAPDVPNLFELGWDYKAEQVVARYRGDRVRRGEVQEMGLQFFEEVLDKQFTS